MDTIILPSTAPACVHCKGRKSVSRPRGLCRTCYYAPGVRDLYPPASKFCRRGLWEGGHGRGIATDAAAGSEEKLAVLAARAAAGQELFHAADSLQKAGSPRRAGYVGKPSYVRKRKRKAS